MLAVSLLASSAGCSQSQPGGQTLATVNGDAITQSELDFELSSIGAPPGDKAARARTLNDLVDRKLLAQAAKSNGLDKQPDYVLARQRAELILLAQREAQSVLAQFQQQQPSASEIESYLRAHSELGEQRRYLQVDQVRFPTPDAKLKAALAPATSLQQLMDILAQRQISFERGSTELDSASLDAASRNKLVATASGEPLIMISGPFAVANRLISTRPVSAPAAAVTALARQRLQSERIEKGLRQRQDALRQSAKIDYAKGLAPSGR